MEDTHIKNLKMSLRKWKWIMLTFNDQEIIPALIKISELFEHTLKEHYKNFCQCKIESFTDLGMMYQTFTERDLYKEKLIQEYIIHDYQSVLDNDSQHLKIVASRLLVNFIPLLETFDDPFENIMNPEFIRAMFFYAHNGCEHLQIYATALLASCITKDQHIINDFEKDNNILVLKLLDRLQSLYLDFIKENIMIHNLTTIEYNTNTWIQMYPITATNKLLCCMKYLSITEKNYEFWSVVHEKSVLNLVMKLLDTFCTRFDDLAVQTLTFLCSLLYNYDISMEFVVNKGVQFLIGVPIHSNSSIGAFKCIHRLIFTEGVITMILKLPNDVVINFVKYVLQMLDSSYEINRLYALRILRYTFYYEHILNIFDSLDGLPKLFNMIMPPSITTHTNGPKCVKYSPIPITPIFCDCLKYYFKAHLYKKAQEIYTQNQSNSTLSTLPMPHGDIFSLTKNDFLKFEKLLIDFLHMDSEWKPVEQFNKCGGLEFILIITKVWDNDITWHTHTDMNINLLEILNICCLLPKIQCIICELEYEFKHIRPESRILREFIFSNNRFYGFIDNLLYYLSKPSIDKDPVEDEKNSLEEVALKIIVNCICSPVHRAIKAVINKETQTTENDILIQKMLDCMRKYNGIMVLLNLITDDSRKQFYNNYQLIARLSCYALSRLAYDKTILHMLEKLPLFSSNKIQSFMGSCITPIDVYLNEQRTSYRDYVKSKIVLEKNSQKVLDPLKNFAMRFSRNIHSRKRDQTLIHSNFRRSHEIILELNEQYLSCYKFFNENHFFIGTNYGTIYSHNSFNNEIEKRFSINDYDHAYSNDIYNIVNVDCTNNGNLVILSADQGTMIWNMHDIETRSVNLLSILKDQHYSTLSNLNQNRILGSKGQTALIYDIETMREIINFTSRYSNCYNINRSVFDATDRLVLSCGVLWDSISGKKIHKFDQLNNRNSGIFHPNGNHILIDSEIWDQRTFQLLCIEPIISKNKISFSKTGEGLYAYDKNVFKTLDPLDYTTITSFNTGMHIIYMACNDQDTKVGTIKLSTDNPLASKKSIIEIYDVGFPMKRVALEEDDE